MEASESMEKNSPALKAQTYLWVAHAGAVALIALGLCLYFGAPDFAQGFLVGMLLVLVAVLFRSKMRDEYIERLWNAGTAAAFITTLLMTVGADLVIGFADDKADVFTRSAFTSPQVGLGALAAFYITFHLAMLRNR